MSPEDDAVRQAGRSDYAGLPDEILNDPRRRRAWLLSKALESSPLDRALELARAAEVFITGSLPDEASNSPQSEHPPALPASKPPKQNLSVSAEQREQLLERLAQGATNAELAAEFGLSSRQVQGFRMGSAREIAARRGWLPQTE
jgi:DNA-binding CsgD family transcriptional regulator